MSSTNYIVVVQLDDEEQYEENEELKQIELEEITLSNADSVDVTHSNGIKSLTVPSVEYSKLGCCCFKPPIHPIMVRKTMNLYPFNNIMSWFEGFRWTLNYIGLCNPFGSFCNNIKYLRYIARVTISDIIILTVFVLFQFLPLYTECVANMNEIISKGSGKRINTTNNEILRDISMAFGHVSVQNYALTLLFAQRNTILNLIFGLPFERCLAYHKFIGLLSILFSFVHFILILFYWADSENNSPAIKEQILKPLNMYGLIALCGATIGGIFSFHKIRRKYWEAFLKTHWILMLLFLIFACLHNVKFFMQSLVMKITIALWLLDIFWRMWLIFGYKKTAKISNVKSISDDIIKINFYKENFLFDGGQYVFLCIPSIAITQWHPFSIANDPSDNKGNITLYIKYLGDWTKRLKYLLKVSDLCNVTALIEGPYGRVSIPMYKYSSIILMCGGIGITPMKSIFAELMEYVRKQNCIRIKRIHFVWCIKKCDHVLKEFDCLHWNIIKKDSKYDTGISDERFEFAEEIKVNTVRIKTSYYVTRVKNENEQNKWKQIYLNLHFERASAAKIIKEAQNCIGSESIGILGCGPVPMINDIKYQAAFNNVHCHTEFFHF